MGRASWLNNFNNNSNFNANNRNINNNNRLRGIAQALRYYNLMAAYRNLWNELCSSQNLELAFRKARKHKTLKKYVIDFEANLHDNLSILRAELLLHSYSPKPLETFILRDPKTRKISKSDFRDRVVHHALCNILEPILEKGFIYDSYANRIGKGAFKAVDRFKLFSKKVSRNNSRNAFVLKADIRHYFDTVDHKILLSILKKRIKDKNLLWLIRKILSNHSAEKGMPLGNLTSQFFANVYLNELDQFVKHKLKAKYYIRYVDDFIIMHSSYEVLEEWKLKIGFFLNNHLFLELHPDKSKIVTMHRGIEFLGFNILTNHLLLKRRNLRKFRRKLIEICRLHELNQISYDKVYDFMEGWCAYAKHADTYNMRKNILNSFEEKFSQEISSKEINRLAAIKS